MAVSHCSPFFFPFTQALILKMHQFLEQSNSQRKKENFLQFLFPERFANWECPGFPGSWTLSTRPGARDSSRYVAWHCPILFTYSSLKIRDDGTHFPGHTLALFLGNCLLYPWPRNSHYSELCLKSYVPNWSSRFQLWGEVDNNSFSTFTGLQRGDFRK